MKTNNKTIYKKVKILAFYDLDEEYISFPENPLHNQTFENVAVDIKKGKTKISDMVFEYDKVCIQGEEPFECDLIDKYMDGDTLVLKICQDWG